jgi:hypothetical protein
MESLAVSSAAAEHECITSSDFVLYNDLLLDNILKNLDNRDLSIISTVSKQWNSIISKLLKRRNVLSHWFYIYQVGNAHSRKKTQVAACFQPNESYIGSDFASLVKYLKEEIKKPFWSKPKFALLFHGNFCPHSQKVSELLDFNLYRKDLPSNCEALSISSSVGLVGSPDAKTTLEVQVEFTPLSGISYLLLPETACNVRIFGEDETLEEFYPRADNEYKKLKGILMFSNGSVDEDENYRSFGEIEKLFNLYDKRIGLGGVVVDDIRSMSCGDSKRHHNQPMAGVAIYGDNVQMASGVFFEETPQDMEQKLMLFKNSLDFNPDDLTQQTIGFVFVCSGRGVHVFGQANAEVGLIKKTFPHVRLTGVFGHGEYGENYWPKNPEMTPLEVEIKDSKFWHFYTTIFVLVNIADKKPGQ